MNNKPNLTFVNLLGHPVTILNVFGESIMAINGDGRKAILAHVYKTRPNAFFGHVPIKDLTIQPAIWRAGVTNKVFPDPQPGTIYLVPANVAGYLFEAGRLDVFCPGPIVREDGIIKGCVGIAQHKGREA